MTLSNELKGHIWFLVSTIKDHSKKRNVLYENKYVHCMITKKMCAAQVKNFQSERFTLNQYQNHYGNPGVWVGILASRFYFGQP